MPVTFRCSECTQKLRIEDAFAGTLVACVRCGSKQRVPRESSPEFAQPQPKSDEPRPAPPPAPKPPKFKPPKFKPPKFVPPVPDPPATESTESKPPRPLKPWQPRPVREEPLPSEIPQLREEPPVEKPSRKSRKSDTPVGELSIEALSAIFDEPIDIDELVSKPEVRKEAPQDSRVIEKRPKEDRDEGQLADESALSGDVLREGESVEDDFEDEVPEYSSPEFEAAPLVAAGSKHFEAGLVPARYDAPSTVYDRAHDPEHAPAASHAEPSMVPPAQKLDVEELIDMTAMVDIVFFLLIFFLVTSMHSLDSTIPMPAPDPTKGAAKEPQTVAAIDADDSYVVVRIDKNDKITVEGAEVRSERDLLFKLRDLRLGASRPEKLLVIGHGDATHGTAVMILDAGRELGMDQVKLTVQDEEE